LLLRTTLYIVCTLILQWLACIQGTGQQQPIKPSLHLVTVDPETGYDIISWHPSPTAGIDYYVVGLAVIPNPLEPYALIQVGTAAPSDTFFINMNTDSDHKSVGYTVYAVELVPPDSTYNSLNDEPDSTIFVSAVFDSCKAAITLSWNDYNSWRGHIREYVVNQRLDNGLYVQLAKLPEGTNNYIFTPVQENMSYRLFIEAVNEDNVRRSASNVVGLYTDMSLIPDAINADYATLGENNSIALSFSIDPGSELQIYKLLRSYLPDGFFDTIATLNTTGKVIKYKDDSPFSSGIFYYKLVAYNNCGKPVVTSNLASTILLTGSADNAMISLKWNKYIDWSRGVEYYELYRESGVQGGAVDSIVVGIDTYFGDDYTYRVDYINPLSSRVCYQVVAVESYVIPDIQNTSRSNRLCINLNPDIHMPNAFIPNSDDGVNNTFGPLFSFAPERFELVIFNRSGLKIWEGSEPWDGKVNGNFATEGVYLYHLRLFNYSNTIRELTGQVTIVYR
jgi:hypothetical protein